MSKGKSARELFSNPYNLLLASFAIFFIFALIANTPLEIIKGMGKILTSTDNLISDYVEIGGIGAALVNAALVGMLSTILIKLEKCEPKGANLMVVWVMCGFAFFGKSVLNVLPIIAGGYLYCSFQKIKAGDNMVAILLATTLSPVVTQFRHIGLSSNLMAIAIGCALGLLIGFIIIPVSQKTKEAHEGFDLYNVGFAGGLIAVVIAGCIRNLGFELETVSFWSEGNNRFFAVFVISVCMFFIIAGAWLSENVKDYLKPKLFVVNDIRTCDCFEAYGFESYKSVGVLGIITTIFVLLVGGELNGPIIGGIFTIIGFVYCGKNLLNLIPITIGCALAAKLSGKSVSDPGILLSILFATALAPIANSFGLFWGIVAGFLHMNTVSKLSAVHGGLNLYNNGFAAGIVVIVLLPVIRGIRKSPIYPAFLKRHNEKFESAKIAIQEKECSC